MSTEYRRPFRVSRRVVWVGREDRTGHEGVPGQAITRSMRKSSRGAGTGVGALRSLISIHSLTDWVFIGAWHVLCAFLERHRWPRLGQHTAGGAGSTGPTTVNVDVGSPLFFPGMLLKPPASAAICQMTAFLSFKGSSNAALNSMRWWDKRRHYTTREVGISCFSAMLLLRIFMILNFLKFHSMLFIQQ